MCPVYKTNKHWVTVMVCGNATGSYKFPLLLLEKSKVPRFFKNVSIPLIYTNQQKRGWTLKYIPRQSYKTIEIFDFNLISDLNDKRL